jgi:hypothetical protein
MNFEPALTPGIVFSDLVIKEHATGKNSLIGSFACYNLPQFPAAVPPFWVTAFVSNIPHDIKSMEVTARVENTQNGLVLASTAAKVQFGMQPKREDATEVCIPILNLGFPAAGLYKVVVLVNNETVGERNLPVNDIRATTQSTPI